MSLSFLRRIIARRARPPHDPDTSQIDISEMQLPGPPAIATARQAFAGRPDVVIDPLEIEFTVSDTGVAVRASVIVPTSDVPAALLRSIVETDANFAGLPFQTRQIFFLAAAYRLSTNRISEILNLGKGSVRRQLLRAIARLDGRTL